MSKEIKPLTSKSTLTLVIHLNFRAVCLMQVGKEKHFVLINKNDCMILLRNNDKLHCASVFSLPDLSIIFEKQNKQTKHKTTHKTTPPPPNKQTISDNT